MKPLPTSRILYLLICFGCIPPCLLLSQTYDNYFGTGNYVGLMVRSSDSTRMDSAIYTVNGAIGKLDLVSASRFLSQATLGHNYEDISALSEMGIVAWLDEQFTMPDSSFLTAFYGKYGVEDAQDAREKDIDLRSNQLDFTFYDFVFNRKDKLRQKMAFALSQILVTSYNGVAFFNNRGQGLADYYDILYQGAFGNYRDILQQVTLHPAMGAYLSSIRNRKADYGLNTRPDENYAREVMQLFSIGLLELDNDGTPKLDNQGEAIPTYTNEDIEEMAKVFTGLAFAARIDGSSINFTQLNQGDPTIPMKMYPAYHDVSEKVMIDGSILPKGRSGLDDINDALDLLFNHPNTGPFISTRLIQNFVKSNPSPAYVNRVATVFNNNGHGVRGDLAAVLRALLMDPEARDCKWIDDPTNGKLIQPLERFTKLLVAFDVSTPGGEFWINDDRERMLEQRFMASPTVFNYFSPFFAEETYIEPEELVSPEFQILNAITAIENLNVTEDRLKRRPAANQYENGGDAVLDLSDETTLLDAQGLDALLDRLDILLCRGQLSSNTRTIIKDAVQQYIDNQNNYSSLDAVHDVLYFLLVSPDYLILR